MKQAIIIERGTVITHNEVLPEMSIHIENGKITEIGQKLSDKNARKIFANGKIVMPGIIDLHSDALEKFIEPRTGASFPLNIAIFEFDKYIASCGITTMFHCVCYLNPHDKHSLRTIDNADKTVEAINSLASHLNVRNKIHLRYDLPSVEGLPNVHKRIQAGEVELLSIMDHTPGQGQFRDIESLMKWYNIDEDEAEKLFKRIEEMQSKIKKSDVENLIEICRELNIPLASHDDDTVEKVKWISELGIGISEFPVTMEALEEAHRQGLHVGFGAPNYIRGKSHSNNISARDALNEGFGDFICSDYSPMTMLHVVFTLRNLGYGSLPGLVNMVTLNPAQAAGVDSDLGSIEAGKTADIIIVDTKSEIPRISNVFVAGKEIINIATP